MSCCYEAVKMNMPHLATVLRYHGTGLGACLNGTSQGPTAEDVGKDAQIKVRSRPLMKYPG